MTIFASIRRKRHSAPVLSAALFAWLGLLIAPCAMALTADHTHSTDAPDIAVHASCPYAQPPQQSQPMTDADCCCDPSDMLRTNAREPSQLAAIAALPMDLTCGFLIGREKASIVPHHALLCETSPPVYLATQRLRI